MIGWMIFRGARKALRGSNKQEPKRQEPQPSWGEIARMPMGAWAIITFAALFVTSAILIGWFVTTHP